MYYLLVKDIKDRTLFIEYMKDKGVNCVFHYVPLHSSPAGKKYGRVNDNMEVTNTVSNKIVRLPLWLEMDQTKVIEEVIAYFSK